jgi:hypothetical protein
MTEYQLLNYYCGGVVVVTVSDVAERVGGCAVGAELSTGKAPGKVKDMELA